MNALKMQDGSELPNVEIAPEHCLIMNVESDAAT